MKVPEKVEDLTVDWFNNIFQPHGIQVHEFKLCGDASNGKGFMGTLEKVDLQISYLNNNPAPPSSEHPSILERLSVILKTLPSADDPIRRTFAVNDGFSSREVCFYTEIFNEWDEFLDSRQVPEASRYRHARCWYGAEKGDKDTYNYILVLENLRASPANLEMWAPGFSEPLPWPAAASVIRQIARMHATGVAYKVENNIESYYDRFPKLKHVVSPAFQYLWDTGFKVGRDMIENIMTKEEIPDGLIDQLDKLHSDEQRDLLLKWFVDPLADLTTRSSICHHDLHSNNLVLNSNHSTAVIIDYQSCCNFNPMKDMSFFMVQNCSYEDNTVNLPRALQLYHDEFNATMKLLQVDFEYSLDTIKKDYDLFLGFTFTHIMTGAEIWLTGSESNAARQKRYAMLLIDAFQRGVLCFPSTSSMKY